MFLEPFFNVKLPLITQMIFFHCKSFRCLNFLLFVLEALSGNEDSSEHTCKFYSWINLKGNEKLTKYGSERY